MRVFRVNVAAVNPTNQDRVTPPVEVLVDTESELTWLPRETLLQINVEPLRKRTFRTATNQTVQREIGYAILRSEGYETIDEVVFAESGDMALLGVRTIEGFGVKVDNVAHKFVAINTLAVSRSHRFQFDRNQSHSAAIIEKSI